MRRWVALKDLKYDLAIIRGGAGRVLLLTGPVISDEIKFEKKILWIINK